MPMDWNVESEREFFLYIYSCIEYGILCAHKDDPIFIERVGGRRVKSIQDEKKNKKSATNWIELYEQLANEKAAELELSYGLVRFGVGRRFNAFYINSLLYLFWNSILSRLSTLKDAMWWKRKVTEKWNEKMEGKKGNNENWKRNCKKLLTPWKFIYIYYDVIFFVISIFLLRLTRFYFFPYQVLFFKALHCFFARHDYLMS